MKCSLNIAVYLDCSEIKPFRIQITTCMVIFTYI